MKILYLDCNMGASGDMLFGALLGFINKKDQSFFIKKVNASGIPYVKISSKTLMKNGVAGNKVFVKIDGMEEGRRCGHSEKHSHHHRKLKDVNKIINKLKISKTVKDNALAVYQSIAQAESKAHNCEVSKIHFHEVGELDAVCDIVGVCMLIEELKAEKIIASPVNVGGGFVKCAHGVLPVPAPAAVELLKDVPIYGGKIKEELCTPTGA
ncbi:MAG: LarC family nickel insertion protein, partial [Endomicrobium sp.]|nr:LarC family nickel insertion protein [Endomicrobium sp.]